ncbi:aromatic acid exporter family protein [Aquicella lusitana]|uniref:Fusaric acid resistance family protein n=1 Tax=Aquicella lusitana TaxID=254246 RepID=A0A370GJ77_9COXI|nr:FUSC family protein [Aquicella lusitana]RDI42434.1 hypothetical protein C8D86_11537 [Aquicella lusitana]VVC74104.1 hypothetical protein AQULUS_18690 [Aquicella lusitana]
MTWLKSFTARHAISAGVAIFLSVYANQHLAYGGEGFLVLTAFLVSQTTRGTPLRQGLLYSLIVLTGILVFALALTVIKQRSVIYLLISAIFMLSGYLTFIYRPVQNKTFFLIMLFSLVLLVIALSPTAISPLRDQFIDAVMGAAIGVICSQIILPVQFDREFCSGLLPLLHALINYSHGITERFTGQNQDADALLRIKSEVEKALQTQKGNYPEWVYEAGFNPGLRAGFRFFLTNLEHLTDTFFSMDYRAAQPVDPELIKKLSTPVTIVTQKNEELMRILVAYLASAQLVKTESDFTSDISELENKVKSLIPAQLELLDISPDFLTVVGFIYDIKEARKLLLQLVSTLPVQ